MILTGKHVARLVRAAREKRKLSQSELSNLIGYRSGQFISNIERGSCSMPVDKIVRAAHYLRVSPQELAAAIAKDFSDCLDQEIDKQNKENPHYEKLNSYYDTSSK